MKIRSIEFEPIGFVRSPETKSRKGSFREVVSEIVVNEDLVQALRGLEEFSHIEVLYFMHLRDPDTRFKPLTHPMGLEEIPAVGVFATRSPNRPNRIGLTVCELLSVQGNVLTTRGLDALDGSPVLDIKGPRRRDHADYPEMRFPPWTETMAGNREGGGK